MRLNIRETRKQKKNWSHSRSNRRMNKNKVRGTENKVSREEV
jgi:hypothetical protein